MLITLSQSSLQDYADCPRRFQLRYLERLAYPAIESEPALENEQHQKEGEYFHRLIQQHLIGIPAEKISKLANTPNLGRWWNNYLSTFHFPENPHNLYPELTLSASLANIRLVAKYDLIALQENKIVIYDWKTYRKRPKNEWLAARLQTRIYRALLVKAGAHLNGGRAIAPEQIDMIYWFAEYPNDPARFPYTAAQFKRDWDMLTKLAQELATTKDFPLTDVEGKCAYCPYRSYCNRGVKAGTGEDLEAELEEININLEQIQEIEF
jgi:CRISPR/Cas system-associated exonuclease Cas4 (RecB family)